MSNESILSTTQNNNEVLASHILERYGIKTVNDLGQFIADNKGSWEDLVGKLRGMGPAKMDAVRQMVKRLKLA